MDHALDREKGRMNSVVEDIDGLQINRVSTHPLLLVMFVLKGTRVKRGAFTPWTWLTTHE